MTDVETSIPLLVTVGHPGDENLYLRFPPKYRGEVLRMLDDAQIDHGSIIELSAGAELAIEAVRVLGPTGSLAALAALINAFARRHRDKKIVLSDGEVVEASGYSAKEVERLLEKRADDQAKLEERWRQTIGELAED